MVYIRYQCALYYVTMGIQYETLHIMYTSGKIHQVITPVEKQYYDVWAFVCSWILSINMDLST